MRLEALFRAEIRLAPAQELGEAPFGRRRIIPITGGSFVGARLSGVVLPGGADWQLVRADGVADLDARYTLETADGALIYVRNRGYRHGPPEVLARGERVDPAQYYTTCARRPGSRRATHATPGSIGSCASRRARAGRRRSSSRCAP